MPRISYSEARIGSARRSLIRSANAIIDTYQQQGYTLTLRQLYYQFVARDLLPNTMKSYKLLGEAVNVGRMGGLIDWTAIEDRTRNLVSLSTWDSPSHIVAACSSQYRNDLWATQRCRVEVWVEKDALTGVVQRACRGRRVPFFSCRGYTSQSEMWAAGMRLKEYVEAGQQIVLLHLGDHDPSGIDMSRDIQDRLETFMEDDFSTVTFKRIALNWEQIQQHKPPPNPAKSTDSRYQEYRRKHGTDSWELDALPPQVLHDLVQSHVEAEVDDGEWVRGRDREDEGRAELEAVSKQWRKAVKAADVG